MKQTAVEWLAEQVNTVKWKFSDTTDREAIIQQAKEMEREQLAKAELKGSDKAVESLWKMMNM